MSAYQRFLTLSEEKRASLLERLTAVSEADLEARYVDLLDEIHDPYRVGDLEFQASDVLRNCDPVALRCGFADFSAGEDWIEIEGTYYFADEFEAALDEVEDEQGESV